MLDFLVWGSLSFVPMTLIHYYLDKLVNPDPVPKKLPDGTYALAKLPAPADRHSRPLHAFGDALVDGKAAWRAPLSPR